MMEDYKVIAKHDLALDGDIHTWTKGKTYVVIQADSHIKIGTDQGIINYVNEVKEQVLEQFEVVK